MKQYEWTFQNIKDNPDKFILFMDNQLDFEKSFKIIEDNVFPKNISADIKNLIKEVRDNIKSFFSDSEIIDYFKEWKHNYIEDYTNHLLIDIETQNEIESVLMRNEKLYKHIINKIMKTTREKTKTIRYEKYMCFESILMQYKQLIEGGWNSVVDNQSKEHHIKQWIATWMVYLSCNCILESCNIQISKKYVADNGLSYVQIQNNFLNQMELLMFNDTNELLWKEVYKCLLEILITINHIKDMEGGEL